jgi:large subunit ribosomal protein L31
MKADIHPKYFDAAEIKCSCGNVIITGSTKNSLKTELCSKCHPFYTGQQKLIDTAGRVDKFVAQRKHSADLQEKARLHKEDKKKKPEAYKEKEIPVEIIERSSGVKAAEVKEGKWEAPIGETLTEQVAKEEVAEAAKEEVKPAKKTRAKKAAVKKAE